MAGFDSFKSVVDSFNNGSTHFTSWRKLPSQVTNQGSWFDFSVVPGNPTPQYYAAAPMESVAMYRSVQGGLYHGHDVPGTTKVLTRLAGASTASVPLNMILCDYLMFYPFIDQSVTDPQFFDNTTTLPRYTDGKGLQIMAVAVGAQAGLQYFNINYTNSEGVSGRTTPNVRMFTQGVTGTLITASPSTQDTCGPFIPLQSGDTGVRSIESVTMLGGDVGLFTLVLVKPLAQLNIMELGAFTEIDFVKDFTVLPTIHANAYLNFICQNIGNMSGAQLNGYLEVNWS
jgi:hypothetical protein